MSRYTTKRQIYTNHKGQWRAKASLMWDYNAQVYKLSFDYVEDFVVLIKQIIPGSDRSYDPKNRIWIVDAKHFDVLDHLLTVKFETYTKLTQKEVEDRYKEFQYSAPQVSKDKELTTFVTLLKGAGIDFEITNTDGQAALKAYRRAALYYHPDRNPERATDMSSLNSSFQNLKAHFGLEK